MDLTESSGWLERACTIKFDRPHLVIVVWDEPRKISPDLNKSSQSADVLGAWWVPAATNSILANVLPICSIENQYCETEWRVGCGRWFTHIIIPLATISSSSSQFTSAATNYKLHRLSQCLSPSVWRGEKSSSMGSCYLLWVGSGDATALSHYQHLTTSIRSEFPNPIREQFGLFHLQIWEPQSVKTSHQLGVGSLTPSGGR